MFRFGTPNSAVLFRPDKVDRTQFPGALLFDSHPHLTYVRLYIYYTYEMKVTASKLRENVYRLLDQVLQNGTPVQIQRKGRTLKIVAEDAPQKTSRLVRRNIINGEPTDLIHLDWSNEWKE